MSGIEHTREGGGYKLIEFSALKPVDQSFDKLSIPAQGAEVAPLEAGETMLLRSQWHTRQNRQLLCSRTGFGTSRRQRKRVLAAMTEYQCYFFGTGTPPFAAAHSFEPAEHVQAETDNEARNEGGHDVLRAAPSDLWR